MEPVDFRLKTNALVTVANLMFDPGTQLAGLKNFDILDHPGTVPTTAATLRKCM